jgi:RimJ/RimL family protein N-acetyltransferase
MDLSHVQIETERLRLVPVGMKFKEEIFREFQEPVTEFVYTKPPEKVEDTEDFIRKAQQSIREGTDLTMAVLKKDSGEFLGCSGIHDLDKGNPEMGVWTKKSAHGNKYGREAVAGLKQWADKNLEFDHVIFTVAAQNIASRKIAESLGGKVGKEYEKTMQSGRTYHMVEYWISKNGEK